MKRALLMLIVISGCTFPKEEVANCVLTETEKSAAENPEGIQITVRPNKEKYLIGEPVMLTVSVKNNTQEEVTVWVPALKNQIDIIVYGNGYKPFHPGDRNADTFKIVPSTEPLPKGAATDYRFTLLYSYGSAEPEKDNLAFPIKGTYCIQAKYPLFPGRKMVDSGLAHITVEKPTGSDAKVWKKLNDPSMLRFLQSVKLGEDEDDIPVELANLLERFPQSGYAESLKRVLRYYYEQKAHSMSPETLKADPFMTKLRKLCDIELKEDPGLFPDDMRLDVKIQYHFPKPTPIVDVLSEISEQSDVPLEVHEALKIRTSKSIPITTTLREFMQNKAAYKAKWIKEGDGYKLIPDPPPAEAPTK